MNDRNDDRDRHDDRHAGRDHDHLHVGPTGPMGLLVWLVAALLLVVVGIGGVQIGRSHNASSSTISVSGTGIVRGTPDTATFNIGVHTTNASASVALAANNQKMQALIAALAKNGVKKKEMQTSGLNIYQTTNNSGVVTGFSVDDILNVTMHNVQKSGAAIDAGATAVGNGIQLNGITFSISNQSKLLALARSKAMKDARLTANQLADAGNAHVTGIMRVSDQETQTPPVYFGASGAAIDKASLPVQTGSEPITVQVSVTYSLAS
jgi:uncharacterized protein YggE